MNHKLLKDYAAKMTAESGRRTTLAEAEAEIARIVLEVSRNISPAFKFGYHTRGDMAQTAAVFALEILEHEDVYDVSRPLAGFLYIHIRNRLSNYRRNNYIRTERPCQCCDPYIPPINPCDKWVAWNNRNIKKQNLMRPLNVYGIADEHERNMREVCTVEEDASVNELMTLIDERLDVDLRDDYLKLKNGVSIPKARKQKVRDAIMEIISDGEEDSDDNY
jgi:hypothetical protein